MFQEQLAKMAELFGIQGGAAAAAWNCLYRTNWQA